MVKKCACGRKLIEYPIWEGQEEGEPFSFKKIKWYNFIIGNWILLVVIFSVLGVALSYTITTEECRYIEENVCSFVLNNTDTCMMIQQLAGPYYIQEGVVLPALNIS